MDTRRHFPELNTRRLQHTPGRDKVLPAGIFVRQVDDLTDAGLDDGLAAFIAGEQCCIDLAAAQVHTDIIQDGIELCMTNIGILGLEKSALVLPGKIIIADAGGQTVIAYAYNFILLVHNTGAHLGRGVLAALPGKQGHAHEVFVPGNIVGSF